MQLGVRWDDQGSISINYENQWHELHTYQMRILQKRANVSCHFVDNMIRSLYQSLSLSHQFIFDYHFEQNSMGFSPPGITIFVFYLFI